MDERGDATETDDGTAFVLGAPWPWEESLVARPGFGWHPDPNMLLLVHDNVTQQMCDDLAGQTDVALIAHGPLVGLMVRFSGGWGWSETMAWRQPGDGIPEHLVDSGNREDRLFFRVVLVDRGTKRIEHMRAFTVSPHMTRAIQREVRDRWVPGVSNEEAMRFREEWNAKHPTINSALKASLARSHGGD